MASTDGSVLVGVTAVGENTAALRYAADAATRTRRGVLAVHAVHQPVPPPPAAIPVSVEELEAVGERMTREVLGELREIAGPDLPIGCEVRLGHPVNLLVDLSRHADVIVLQHRSLSKLHRLFTGSTVVGVAAHARCPVVSVPATWSPQPGAGRVSVGVHEDGRPVQVLEVAFAEAASRRARLHVFHAWRLASPYADLALPSDEEAENRRTLEAIDAEIAGLREKYPDVEVDTEVRSQWPADALVDVGAGSDLLVLGRHGSFAPLPQRIGSLARSSVEHAPCPVMVVPVERHHHAVAHRVRAESGDWS